jgi:hypothetical protein
MNATADLVICTPQFAAYDEPVRAVGQIDQHFGEVAEIIDPLKDRIEHAGIAIARFAGRAIAGTKQPLGHESVARVAHNQYRQVVAWRAD